MMSKIAVVTGGNKGKRAIFVYLIYLTYTYPSIHAGIGFSIVKALVSKFDGLIYLTGMN
jgi:hypothetical protein